MLRLFQSYKLEENMPLAKAKEGLEKGRKEMTEGEIKVESKGLVQSLQQWNCCCVMVLR